MLSSYQCAERSGGHDAADCSLSRALETGAYWHVFIDTGKRIACTLPYITSVCKRNHTAILIETSGQTVVSVLDCISHSKSRQHALSGLLWTSSDLLKQQKDELACEPRCARLSGSRERNSATSSSACGLFCRSKPSSLATACKACKH